MTKLDELITQLKGEVSKPHPDTARLDYVLELLKDRTPSARKLDRAGIDALLEMKNEMGVDLLGSLMRGMRPE